VLLSSFIMEGSWTVLLVALSVFVSVHSSASHKLQNCSVKETQEDRGSQERDKSDESNWGQWGRNWLITSSCISLEVLEY